MQKPRCCKGKTHWAFGGEARAFEEANLPAAVVGLAIPFGRRPFAVRHPLREREAGKVRFCPIIFSIDTEIYCCFLVMDVVYLRNIKVIFAQNKGYRATETIV
jgi:hypothetical protein